MGTKAAAPPTDTSSRAGQCGCNGASNKMASTPTLPAKEAGATKKSIRLPPGLQVPRSAWPPSSTALGSNRPRPSATTSDRMAATSSFESPPTTHWAAPSPAKALEERRIPLRGIWLARVESVDRHHV